MKFGPSNMVLMCLLKNIFKKVSEKKSPKDRYTLVILAVFYAAKILFFRIAYAATFLKDFILLHSEAHSGHHETSMTKPSPKFVNSF